MENWLERQVNLTSPLGNRKGKIHYGIRKPIAPAINPLITVQHGSRTKVEGQRPQYWFVADPEGEYHGLKVRLSYIHSVNEKEIRAIARDGGHIFTTIITPLEQ